MEDFDDPLVPYRRPGSSLPGKDAMRSSSGIKLREYRAFVADSVRSPLLYLRRGLVKHPLTARAFSYGDLRSIVSDEYGFFFSLTFSLAFPDGNVTVEFGGEGMNPLLDGIRRNVVSEVQIFDPEKFLPPEKGDFDADAYEWRGPVIVKELNFVDKSTPHENTSRH